MSFSSRFRVVFESFSRLTRGELLGRRAIDGIGAIVAIGGIGVFLAGGYACAPGQYHRGRTPATPVASVVRPGDRTSITAGETPASPVFSSSLVDACSMPLIYSKS